MKKSILFIADHIAKEGTSKMVKYLANGLANWDEFEVGILLFRNIIEDFGEGISNKVHLHTLEIEGSSKGHLLKIMKSITTIKPDILFVSFTQHMPYMAIIGSFFKLIGIKVIYRETIIPSLYRVNFSKHKKKLFGFLYNSYNKIIAQSQDMRDDLINNWYVKKERIYVINNPIKVKRDITIPTVEGKLDPLGCIKFVAVGRLEKQKGYDILLKRMSEMPREDLFNVDILGEGSLFDSLNEQILEYNLQDHVRLVGFKKDTLSYMLNANGLILPSRYEGFPNVVLEANSIGLPVFANTCPGGINEIIVDGRNGVACNFNSISDFIEGYNKFKSINFDGNAIVDMTELRYGYDNILAKYKDLFKTL